MNNQQTNLSLIEVGLGLTLGLFAITALALAFPLAERLKSSPRP